MQKLEIQLPDTVNIDAQEIQLLLAGKLYEKGLLSIGQAAQIASFPNMPSWSYWGIIKYWY